MTEEEILLAALAAAVPDDLAEAGKVLEGVTLAIDSDDDAYVLPSGAENNLVALPARDDDYAIQHPEIWQAMVARFNAYPALLARIAAQEKETNLHKTRAEIKLSEVITYRERAEAAETALAAERAKTAKLVEAGKPFCFYSENEPAESLEDAVQHAWEIRYQDRFKDWIDFADIIALRAAITEASQ